MSYTIDDLDWSNTDQYMQPSSENGSDGEPYQVEANQNAEMVRVLTRRKDREAREGLDDIKHEHTSISPSPMPRPSAVLSETVTKRLYAVGGALDSQYSSQAYIDDLQNINGYGESQPRSPLIQGQLSPTLSPKQEPEYSFIASHESSEAENLREEIHALENLRKTEQGKYFTSLELANKERDKYRDEARKWRTLAENALNLLKRAQGELGTVINDLEDGV
ncbi:hypothetical protein C8R43DRAFT_1172818 [Mycena crocata]|nr:hypothetical protein C8R43DRAFT_1172818 [Mycena crocata]